MNEQTAREYRTIEVAPMAGALGAEIRGVDLRVAPAGEQLAEIRRAWLEHRSWCSATSPWRPPG